MTLRIHYWPQSEACSIELGDAAIEPDLVFVPQLALTAGSLEDICECGGSIRSQLHEWGCPYRP